MFASPHLISVIHPLAISLCILPACVLWLIACFSMCSACPWSLTQYLFRLLFIASSHWRSLSLMSLFTLAFLFTSLPCEFTSVFMFYLSVLVCWDELLLYFPHWLLSLITLYILLKTNSTNSVHWGFILPYWLTNKHARLLLSLPCAFLDSVTPWLLRYQLHLLSV